MTNKSLLGVFGTILASSMIIVLVKIKIGRQLLLNYPELFTFGLITRENPSQETMDKCISKMTLIGNGWENDDDIEKVAPTKKMNVHVCIIFYHIILHVYKNNIMCIVDYLQKSMLWKY